jgi:hypothetical protein
MVSLEKCSGGYPFPEGENSGFLVPNGGRGAPLSLKKPLTDVCMRSTLNEKTS